jgi:hypothetical protein
MIYYFSGLNFGTAFAIISSETLSYYMLVLSLILIIAFLIDVFRNYGDNS